MYVALMPKTRSAQTLRLTVPALMGVHLESQEDLGQAIGLTQGQISRKLAGKAVITLDDCDKIAEHYGISILELLSGTEIAVTKSLEAKAKESGPAIPG